MSLSVRLSKTYRSGVRIEGELSIPVESGSVFVLFGPSGCGKTTWLRCIAGIERPEHGAIHWADECWFDSSKAIHWSPQKRKIGFVFQENALFPHLTVEDNIAYGIKDKNSLEKNALVSEFVSRLQLHGLERRYPRELSVGQSQRVALARTLATRPRLLLLDEPFAALDTPLRHELRRELRTVLSEIGIPTILVTHDRLEAMSLGKLGALLYDGRVLERGLLETWMHAPRTRESARCVGCENIIPCELTTIPSPSSAADSDSIYANETIVDPRDCRYVRANARHSKNPFPVQGKWMVDPSDSSSGAKTNQASPQCYACFSADSIRLEFAPPVDQPVWTAEYTEANHWRGRIKSAIREGAMVRLEIDAGLDIVALLPHRDWENITFTPNLLVNLTVRIDSVQIVGSLDAS